MKRVFGLLFMPFHIFSRPTHFWYRKNINYIIRVSMIMQNTIFEAWRDSYESGMMVSGLACYAQN